MRAADARKLKIGDWVRAAFSGRGIVKACEIIAIHWPRFVLRTKDHKGDPMTRERRYESLIDQVAAPDGSRRPVTPEWLTWKDTNA